eukprot:564334-Prorocentrum_minimum.AAC.1
MNTQDSQEQAPWDEWTTEGVGWSSDDAHGPQHRLQTGNRVEQHVKGGIPGASLRVEYLAGSGTQDLTVVGERQTLVCCAEADGFTRAAGGFTRVAGGFTGCGADGRKPATMLNAHTVRRAGGR